jgi:hypothetical protein
LNCGKTACHIVLFVVVGGILRKSMVWNRQTGAVAFGALALSAAALGCSLSGCSSPIADLPSLGSMDSSAKPKEPYLPVHDLPPQRDDAVIPPDERAKIESELIAVRDHQAAASAAQTPAAQTTTAQATTAQGGTTQAAQATGSK